MSKNSLQITIEHIHSQINLPDFWSKTPEYEIIEIAHTLLRILHSSQKHPHFQQQIVKNHSEQIILIIFSFLTSRPKSILVEMKKKIDEK